MNIYMQLQKENIFQPVKKKLLLMITSTIGQYIYMYIRIKNKVLRESFYEKLNNFHTILKINCNCNLTEI